MELFEQSILEKIGKYLLNKKETIAVSESVTSGLLQFAFSNIPDAIRFFQGGVTAYNIAQKFKHLNVEPIHALAVNCVSPQVAEEMALHICKVYNSHWGIGVTGYASPVPESEHQLYAFYSIVYKGEIQSAGEIRGAQDDPTNVQLEYAKVVLENLAAIM